MKLSQLLAFFAVGCQVANTPPDSFTENKKLDMVINAHEGIAVLPEQDQYSFYFESKVELDTFIFSTCSRELLKESAWNVKQEVRYGPFKWLRKLVDSKTEIKFDFRPNTIERDDCLIEAYGISKGAKVSGAFVLLSSHKYNTNAYIECNGDIYKSDVGVTACQSRSGKYQSISFDIPMQAATTECGFTNENKKNHQYNIADGVCTTIFYNESKTIFHKLLTYGYNTL